MQKLLDMIVKVNRGHGNIDSVSMEHIGDDQRPQQCGDSMERMFLDKDAIRLIVRQHLANAAHHAR